MSIAHILTISSAPAGSNTSRRTSGSASKAFAILGRSAGDLCLRRLYESDFQDALLGEQHWAVLLTVQT